MPRSLSSTSPVASVAVSHPGLLALAAILTLAPAGAAQSLYLTGSVGPVRTGDARFQDRDCESTSPPALFGCGVGEDGRPFGAYGDFGTSVGLDLGIGMGWALGRVEASVGRRPGRPFRGQANFTGAGGDQPVRGEVTTTSAGVGVELDLAPLGIGIGPLRPFVGVGAGVSRHVIRPVRFEFPAIGADASTTIVGGTTNERSWSATLGASAALSRRLALDIRFRHSDMGELRTGEGEAEIVRPDRELAISIDRTRATLTEQSLSVGLRVSR